ncbi:unnamed protein product [Ectocarpus sp. 12 AP-2014]
MLESGGSSGSTNGCRDAVGEQLMGSFLSKTAYQEPAGKSSSSQKKVEIEGATVVARPTGQLREYWRRMVASVAAVAPVVRPHGGRRYAVVGQVCGE